MLLYKRQHLIISNFIFVIGRSSTTSDDTVSISSPHQATSPVSLSQKLSLDSGFSDSSESKDAATSSKSGKISKEGLDRKSKIVSNCNNTNTNTSGRKIKSSVVHETHAMNSLNKLQHVSKVYFYSVADVLQEGGGGATGDLSQGDITSTQQELGYTKQQDFHSMPGTP